MVPSKEIGPEFQSKQSDTNGISDLADTQRRILKRISPKSFDKWYRELQFAKNIRNGTPFFNGPSGIKPPERHSPSGLLQCHRKKYYTQLNAPEESESPTGIFWIGSRFEEDIALPFLRDSVTHQNEYVTNSLWVDFDVHADSGELHIKGETDPVIVDSESNPLVVTEIKTKESVDGLETPNKHHQAQVHAYMKGLSEQNEENVTDSVIIYGGRTDLKIRAFHIPFDPLFWDQTVVEWASNHTEYRLQDELPPADPEYSWECNFCPYRERCGQGDSEYSDIGPVGLLPGLSDYPKMKVIEYLEAHETAKVTPNLAYQFPELSDKYPVYDWQCRVCGSTFAWSQFEWNGNLSELPQCPECTGSDPIGILEVPAPVDQLEEVNNVDG
jgi:CRISPR/Cas system-associated exonuclease Cas4 (RecB family)